MIPKEAQAKDDICDESLSDKIWTNGVFRVVHLFDLEEAVKKLKEEFEKGEGLTKSPNTLLFLRILKESVDKIFGSFE